MQKSRKIIMGSLIVMLIILNIMAFFVFAEDDIDNIFKKDEITFDDINNEKLLLDVNNKEIEEAKIKVFLNGEPLDTELLMDTSYIDFGKLGEYELIYYIIYNGERYEYRKAVQVVDREKPIIKLKGNSSLTLLLGTTYSEPGYTVNDNYDKEEDLKVSVTGNVDMSKTGEYKLDYTVNDSSLNQSSVTRVINVIAPKKVVIAPKEEKKVVPKVVESNYVNTIKENRFKSDGVYLVGYIKDILDENVLYLKGNTEYSYKLNINNNHYEISLPIADIADGEYKIYVNEMNLINKINFGERLSRGKVGNKLVTFIYDENDYVTVKISPHEYLYDVLINPGHGGFDTGATNEYEYEKDMNLVISRYEKCRYESMGYRVYMTRNSDVYGDKMGDNSLIPLHKVAYEMGYIGAVSKIVYSNHNNSIGNNRYRGYEILVPGSLSLSDLSDEVNIARAWDQVWPNLDNHLRFYARDFDTEAKAIKLDGATYSFKDNYAVNRIPLKTAGVKSIIYEGCYLTNMEDFTWYWQDGNWVNMSEIKIKQYVNSLGGSYSSDNASCLGGL